MDEEKELSDKTEEPTQHRRDEFRRKGEVASSKELTSILILIACSMTLALSIVYIFETFSGFLNKIYNLPAEVFYDKTKIKDIFYDSLKLIMKCAGPIYLVTVIFGVFSQLAQVGFIFSTEVISLKFERINPINGMKKLFSKKSFVEVIKGIFKFTIILAIAYYLIKDEMPKFTGLYYISTGLSFEYMKSFSVQICFAVLGGLIVVALGDFLWEKYSYHQKLKMTKKEAKQELKEKEGNPEVRQRIKTIQRELAQKRMVKQVPQADVVVTNPTHYSVAIQYDPKKMIAPIVIAKGVDALALQIRKIAKKNDIPMVENRKLARELYSSVSEGNAIPNKLYKAVAEILAFVYKLKKKKKALELT